jgi:uncharacterized Zn finger protein (UPF0148 family)
MDKDKIITIIEDESESDIEDEDEDEDDESKPTQRNCSKCRQPLKGTHKRDKNGRYICPLEGTIQIRKKDEEKKKKKKKKKKKEEKED